MTMLEDRSYVASDDALLPVLYRPPVESGGRRGGGHYQPKHAFEAPKQDRTTLWVILVFFVTSAFVAGTTATFFGSATDSGNVFGSATLSNPSGQSVALKGSELSLGIDNLGGFDGRTGPEYGARYGYMWPSSVSNTGANSGACGPPDTPDYSELHTSASAISGEISYLGVSGYAPGRWMCVMGFTAYPKDKPAAPLVQWFSQKDNPESLVQLGHVVQSVSLVDKAGTSNRIQKNDEIVITFNQPVDPTDRPTSGQVCARNFGDKIFVGMAGNNCNNNNPTEVSLLYLEPAPGVTLTADGSYTSTTWSWSGDKQLTIKLLSNGNVPILGCTSNCFRVRMGLTTNPSTALESQLTPTLPLCTAADDEDFANGTCEPYATGSF